jgi:DNA-binding MltR family transcriptional regulator
VAAYSLGLITGDERDDLDCIRDIRNDFAHQPTGPSFTDESIAKNVHKLKMPNLMPKEIFDPSMVPPRELFRNAVSMLYTFIDIRTRNSQERRMHPKGFIMASTKPPA